MHDVFISYSTKDRDQAYAIRAFLTGRGIACWMAPESIPSGSNYTKEIPVAIRGCQVFLLILSENAQNSPWVLRELDAAVNNSKHILPFMLDSTPLNDEFQFLLSGSQWHPAWQENALIALADRIRTVIGGTPGVDMSQPTIVVPLRERAKTANPAPAPTPAPVSAPIPPAAPKAAPVRQPRQQVSQPQRAALHCPTCGGANLQPRKKGRGSYSFGEKLRLFGAWYLALVMTAVPISFMTAVFQDEGAVYVGLVFSVIAGCVCIPLFLNICKKRIARSRLRKRIRVWGVRCRSCGKKFRAVQPVDTQFPWELLKAVPAPPTDTVPKEPGNDWLKPADKSL